MRFAFHLSLAVCLGAASLAASETDAGALRILRAAPLRFEPAADAGGFVARGPHFDFSFSSRGAVLRSPGASLRLTFAGASSTATIEGLENLRSTTNVILGADPAKWRIGLPNYARLRVNGLYPGIDALYYGTGERLEYDLIVRPGTDPRLVRLRFDVPARLDADGNLAAGFIQKRPLAYQIAANGRRMTVPSRYRKNADGTFGFVLGRYDRTKTLIVDPALTLSTFLGGSQSDYAIAIGHDLPGFIYVAGATQSSDFQTNGNPVATTLTGSSNLFLVKIDPHATPDSQVVVATYLGGTGSDVLFDMAVNPQGNVYLTGSTTSVDFPMINAAYSTLNGNSDGFVLSLDAFGNMLYSSYFGGSGDDTGSAVAFDQNGRIFVSGTSRSTDFPIAGGFQTVNGSAQTAVVIGFDPSQSGSASLIYSTYLGGSGGETGRGIAAAPDGTLWTVGGTFSGDFPISGNTYQPVYSPGGDAYVVQINPGIGGIAGLLYATYLGGSGEDEAKRVLLDSAGRVVVCGYTASQDFPVTADAMQAVYGGNYDVFVTILNPQARPAAQIVYSTYYGGSQPEIAYDMKQDSSGDLYLSGFTMSPDLPLTGNALQRTYSQTLDGFALEFTPRSPGLGGMLFSSYLQSDGDQIAYGVDYDPTGNIYVAGYTTGPIFDALGGSGKATSAGNEDGFVMGFSPCSYGISSRSQQFPEAGGSAVVNVTASTPNCPWTASSSASWISISPAGGSGNGAVTITVAQNDSGAARTATITIAGASFAVTQDQ